MNSFLYILLFALLIILGLVIAFVLFAGFVISHLIIKDFIYQLKKKKQAKELKKYALLPTYFSRIHYLFELYVSTELRNIPIGTTSADQYIHKINDILQKESKDFFNLLTYFYTFQQVDYYQIALLKDVSMRFQLIHNAQSKNQLVLRISISKADKIDVEDIPIPTDKLEELARISNLMKYIIYRKDSKVKKLFKDLEFQRKKLSDQEMCNYMFFTAKMLAELVNNAYKGDFSQVKDIDFIKKEIDYHKEKYEKAAIDKDEEKCQEYIADIANLYMMLFNCYR